MTREEILSLPATVDLPTAGRALGIGRGNAYELAARGEFPCKVLKLGSRYRVVTSDLRETLGVRPGDHPDDAEAAIKERPMSEPAIIANRIARTGRRFHLVTDQQGRIAVGTCTPFEHNWQSDPPEVQLAPGLIWVHATYDVDNYEGDSRFVGTSHPEVWEVRRDASSH